MIVIVESSQDAPVGSVEQVRRTGPEGLTTCCGRVVGPATSEEYVRHLLDVQGFPPDRIPDDHGPFYYKVAVD